MNGNVGNLDRLIRLIVGAALIVAPLLNLFGLGSNAVIAYGLMGIGGILGLTAIFGLCPLYRIAGISSK